MRPVSRDLDPRSCVVTLSPQDARAIKDRLQLGDDPYDPRQSLALASHGFLSWLQDQVEDVLDDSPEALSGLIERNGQNWWDQVQADWPRELQRPSWLLRVKYFGHSLALVVVVRRKGATARAIYAVPTQELSGDIEAVCCIYVQIDGDGEVGVLLDGWVDAKTILQKKQASAPDFGQFVRIDEASLQPMQLLFELLHQPSQQAAPPPAPPPTRFDRKKLIYPLLLGFSSAAAVLLGVLFYIRPERVVERPVEVVKHVPPKYSRPVVDLQLDTESLRGAARSVPVVKSGQNYSLDLRVASTHKLGWLFQVDSRGVHLLTRLTEQPDGTLAGRYKDSFDQRPGWEYFVTVLANKAVPELEEKPGQVHWLNEREVEQLQTLGRDQDDQGAVKLIQKALDRTGLRSSGYHVRVVRVDHRAE